MESLYRGKHIKTNDWIISNSLMQIGKTSKLYDSSIDDWVEIQPGTLGKYTSFNDENDKEIFVGDFVEYNNFIFQVIYEYGCCCLEAISDYYIPYHFLPTQFTNSEFIPKSCDNVVSFFDLTWNDDIWNIQFKVIGNNFDNPEILLEALNG